MLAGEPVNPLANGHVIGGFNPRPPLLAGEPWVMVHLLQGF
ncbi:hypothetical protein BLL52_1456 [Rhodoferax antarcticus ANT.BR]|uniref:Uncharacterized protein n=1 Tax=Rhodoferax antarcticus ANT.BR TaxID=1111071 RepID=A0A1Q8YGX3_9BURK|nr:hypothetical protein BLL52_1456 [Rhodoferax antarcticus ANT.BR]